ncbi:hypothetical protein [Eggerthella guodeyinii]|uniref:WxL domain-containing protein n=1 Tax=Eggerthella guodeyinii TaxID=2690837 RepID=A0A6N7RPV9_9ACTN|nr:hypothetical protein [Eggerthella guodeyinii]MRX83032.1 hypothetical protein [Eggerthella guodeyinii]
MSKMTNLKKGVVGVCAATMLAGMCAVPAFAAVTEGNTAAKKGIGSSEVTVKSDIQVSATLPTTIPLVLNSSGFTAPTFTFDNTTIGYGIQLKSVQITNVVADNGMTIKEDTTDISTDNQLRLKVADKTNAGNTEAVIVKQADSSALNWDIAAATDASNPGNLSVEMTVEKGDLNGTFLNKYATSATKAFDVTWTVGF